MCGRGGRGGGGGNCALALLMNNPAKRIINKIKDFVYFIMMLFSLNLHFILNYKMLAVKPLQPVNSICKL